MKLMKKEVMCMIRSMEDLSACRKHMGLNESGLYLKEMEIMASLKESLAVKSVTSLNDLKIVYLTNSLGETTDHKEAESRHLDWYRDVSVSSAFLHYLAEINGQVGMLSLCEISHPNDEDWNDENDCISDNWRKMSANEIWEHLEMVRDEMQNRLDFEVVLGRMTGFFSRHEVCIWYPVGTDKQLIRDSFEKIKDINIVY